MVRRRLLVIACLASLACGSGSAPGALEVRIPTGAGGIGFLPLLVMQKYKLLEEFAAKGGLPNLSVKWIDLGGPSAMNDALLSGSVDFIAAGPPAFLTLWDATYDSLKVKGVAAMSSLPMYLNARDPRLMSLDDFRQGDKIGVTAIKVSIPAIVMQMAAAEKYGMKEATRYDKFTVPITHPDGVIAMLSNSGVISAHFTSPPFEQIELGRGGAHTILTTSDVFKSAATFTMVSTTTKFAESNPKVIDAFVLALEEAIHRIQNEPKAAAALLLSGKGAADGGLTEEEMISAVERHKASFGVLPNGTMKYADFMYQLGSIKHRPASWKELFFSRSWELDATGLDPSAR
jgi:NitT/TauT family transport system substrate-binding protein